MSIKSMPGTTLEEIAGNDYNLNIPRYVEPLVEEETITVEEAIGNLKKALSEAYAAEDRLKDLLQKSGLM
jgi:type I restriction enzyme M protein